MAYKKNSTYVSKPVDAAGYSNYSDSENKVWEKLITRQMPLVAERACQEYIQGVEMLNMPKDRIPQCPEVSAVLQKRTGWALEPVPALIPFEQFFYLLAHRKFPAATFIRRLEELDYLEEPDIFHEIFGHCPLLTHAPYAEFTHTYGKLGLNASPEDRVLLAKLYWFTIEFGLIQTSPNHLRIYGGGILSSMKETISCLNPAQAVHKPFDVLEILRTPYRINIVQPVYFIIDSWDILFNLTQLDLMSLIAEARRLGMHEPLY